MSRPYFRQVPDFLYVNRKPGEKTISDYSQVKNLFKRAKLREDIYSNLSYFTKYKITGDERPDNVAEKVYNDPTLDWVILLSNNITNIQTEWPITEQSYHNFLLEKYGSEEKIHAVHHYECTGVKNIVGGTIVQEGLRVPVGFAVTYYDSNLASTVSVGGTHSSIIKEVTNLDYENEIQDKKRNIFLLKTEYLNVVCNDLDDIMEYKKGSTHYVSETLKRAENIRLYPNS